MPNVNERISFRAGIAADFQRTAIDANSIYFCTDTKQIFLGNDEYTKGTKVLTSQPNENTSGDDGRLYAYNGSLYLCQVGEDGSTFNWIRVANVNDGAGGVVSVGAGDGLDTTADSDNPITKTGTIVHAIPEGAEEKGDELADTAAKFGQSFQIESVETDKFGHVISVNIHTITLPEETAVSVKAENATEQTELGFGDTFQVVSQVEKGDGSHEVKSVVKEFKLPEAPETKLEGLSTSYNPETDTVTIS